jgi:citrate lyase subunit beta/citryl-CoA lyase
LARAGAETLLALDGGPAVVIRVNAPGPEWFAQDIADAAVPGLTAIIVPKLETVEEAARAAAALDAAGCPTVGIVAGIETARGVADARPLLAAPRVVGCYFGAEDFTADMGAYGATTTSRCCSRAQVALAAPRASRRSTSSSPPSAMTNDSAARPPSPRVGSPASSPPRAGRARQRRSSSPRRSTAPRLLAPRRRRRRGRAAIAFEGQMVDEPSPPAPAPSSPAANEASTPRDDARQEEPPGDGSEGAAQAGRRCINAARRRGDQRVVLVEAAVLEGDDAGAGARCGGGRPSLRSRPRCVAHEHRRGARSPRSRVRDGGADVVS